MMDDTTGLAVAAIPTGWTVLEAVAAVKCLDEDGEVALLLRSTDGLRVWDRVGLLTVALDTAREDAKASFVPADDDNDDDT